MNMLSKFCQRLKKNLINKCTQLFGKKTKLNVFIDMLALFSFFISFLSIPLFSFRAGLSKITWIFTMLFLLLMFISMFLFGKIQIDKISLSLLLFVIWMMICSLVSLNLHSDFYLTPVLLSIVTLIVYMFLYQNKQYRMLFMHLLFLAIILFTLYYVILYFDDLKSLDFNRLGGYFGNVNDAAIALGVGFSLCVYYMINSKFSFCRFILLLLLLLVFTFCGLSTGSKIFVLITICASVGSMIIFMRIKKARWYWYLISFICLVLIAFAILNIPAFRVIKDRLLSFISLNNKDNSTIIRFNMFIDGFYMFLRRPVFGFGIRAFYVSSSFGNGWSHNNFSELLCSYGLVGFVLFYIPYFLAIKSKCVTKKFINDPANILMIIFICCMFSVALESQKIFAYSIPVFYTMYNSSCPIELFQYKKTNKEVTSL